MSNSKRQEARKRLRERLEKLGWKPGHQRLAKLDRLRGTCQEDPGPAVRGLPHLNGRPSRRLRRPMQEQFQAYGRAQWFLSKNSAMKASIESDRREPWLAPFRITLYADDRTGLLPKDVFPILEVLPDFQLSLIEVAIDFLTL